MDALLLMAHGTRDQDGVSGLLDLVDAVRERAGRWRVEAGVLEFPGPRLPSIQQAIDGCVEAEVERIVAVPLLLHEAGHNNDDMPEQIARARERHPLVDLRPAPALGLHSAFLDATEERIRDLDAGLRPGDPDQTAVLLVGRGTTTPSANADFYKVGRLVWERLRYALVECCFVSLAAPGVPAGIERCARLGARRILVIPYFLHTGVLVKRIELQALGARTSYPGIEIAVGEPLGPHPSVVQLVLHRAQALLPGKSETPVAAAVS